MALTVPQRASLLLGSVDAFRRLRLRQIRLKAFRFIAFGSLRARHRVVARDPVVNDPILKSTLRPLKTTPKNDNSEGRRIGNHKRHSSLA
jgi:hypothetical protein